jgi:hypothetical protein
MSKIKQTSTSRTKTPFKRRNTRPQALRAILDRIQHTGKRTGLDIARSAALEIAASALGLRNSHELVATAAKENLSIQTIKPFAAALLREGYKPVMLFRDPTTDEVFGLESNNKPALATSPSGALVMAHRNADSDLDTIVNERRDTKLFIGIVDHKHGQNTYSSPTLDGLYEELASYCKEYWDELGINPDVTPFEHFPTEQQAVDYYFETHHQEYLTLSDDTININDYTTKLLTPKKTEDELDGIIRSWDLTLPSADPCIDIDPQPHNPTISIHLENWDHDSPVRVGTFNYDLRRFLLSCKVDDINRIRRVTADALVPDDPEDILVSALCHDGNVHIGPSSILIWQEVVLEYLNGEMQRIEKTMPAIESLDDLSERFLHKIQSNQANQKLLALLHATNENFAELAAKAGMARLIKYMPKPGIKALQSLFD